MVKKIGICIFVLFVLSSAVIKPNPLISKNKPIFASFSGSPIALVNGKYGETVWRVTDSSWVAIKLEPGPTKILFTWNATNYMWSDELGNPGVCSQGLPIPVSYRILLSDNSTNGKDGTWNIVDSVSENTVAARSHIVKFKEAMWIKMLVDSGGGGIDELEVFDLSNGGNDTWFFVGTGITAHAFKKPVQRKTFAFYLPNIVKDYGVTASPAFLRGGNGCITSTGLAADIDKYLAAAQGIKYLAIEIGTYDADGGGAENVNAFTRNIQTIISRCRAHKVEPIFARIPATNPQVASWQVHEDFLTALDKTVKKNHCLPGPDLYTWFLQNPDELGADGILPSPRGGASIQRLWAEAVYTLYIDKKK